MNVGRTMGPFAAAGSLNELAVGLFDFEPADA